MNEPIADGRIKNACFACQHQWQPRKAEVSKECPSCKSKDVGILLRPEMIRRPLPAHLVALTEAASLVRTFFDAIFNSKATMIVVGGAVIIVVVALLKMPAADVVPSLSGLAGLVKAVVGEGGWPWVVLSAILSVLCIALGIGCYVFYRIAFSQGILRSKAVAEVDPDRQSSVLKRGDTHD